MSRIVIPLTFGRFDNCLEPPRWGFLENAARRDPWSQLLSTFGPIQQHILRRLQHDESESSSSRGGNKETEKFHVCLDVNQFVPDELSVKTVDNYVVVHGKHEERLDKHGSISREFTRRYLLPDGVQPDTVKGSLGTDGILTIEAPLQSTKDSKERVVPITREVEKLTNGENMQEE